MGGDGRTSIVARMRDRRLESLARDMRGWLVVVAVGSVFGVQAIVDGGVTGRGVLLSAGAALAIAVCAVLALDRRRLVLAGTALAIASPGVLHDVARGGWSGTLAVLLGAAVLVIVAWWRPEPGTLMAAIVSMGVLALIWWFATGETRVGDAPSWGQIVGRTGDTLRASIAGVGGDPESGVVVVGAALMVWIVAVGAVVGAAVVAGLRRVAVVVPAALAAFVVTAWAIERWRGPVDPRGGAWLLLAALAAVGAASRLRRDLDRRLGRVIIVLVAASWLLSLVQQVRRDGVSPGELAAAIFAPVLVVGAMLAFDHRRGLPAGVNVIGYFDVTSGLGERARALVEVLRAGGVEVSEWNVPNTASPPRHEVSPGSARPHDAPVRATTIAVVTALEFGGLSESHHELIDDVDRVIGYWFWELDTVPDSHAHALSLVDEVWAPSRFVRDAYRAATHLPVRLVALPIPEPAPARPEADPFDRGRDTVFLVSFDHLSVMERKNPLGAIEAFGRAFPAGDEPAQLVIKTINGDRVGEDAAALRTAADDPRIRVWDEHLADAQHLGLVAAADAYVSLHRSEGLGLQPAAAMWLGTPVIASDYSGTTDLMDAGTALLVPVTPTGVVDGRGAYPPDATWAEPDLDAAAAAMRRVVDDPRAVGALAAAARSRLASQVTTVVAGRAVRRMLTGWASEVVMWSPTDTDRVDSVAAMESTMVRTPERDS